MINFWSMMSMHDFLRRWILSEWMVNVINDTMIMISNNKHQQTFIGQIIICINKSLTCLRELYLYLSSTNSVYIDYIVLEGRWCDLKRVVKGISCDNLGASPVNSNHKWHPVIFLVLIIRSDTFIILSVSHNHVNISHQFLQSSPRRTAHYYQACTGPSLGSDASKVTSSFIFIQSNSLHLARTKHSNNLGILKSRYN